MALAESHELAAQRSLIEQGALPDLAELVVRSLLTIEDVFPPKQEQVRAPHQTLSDLRKMGFTRPRIGSNW